MQTPTIVITGTSSGFGQLAVARFARSGWNVVATVRKESNLTAHHPFPNVATLLLDVDDETADSEFGELALSQFGRIDAVINNAGYFQGGPLEASTMDQVHRQFQTNVFGLIAVNRAFIPILREQRSGVIVNVSSISADGGYPYTSVYQASKAAVASLTEGLHAELAEFGVQVKALHPGSHETKIFSKVDPAENVPADYESGWASFASLNLVRSDPAGTAEVMFQMVTDGNRKPEEGALLQWPRRRGRSPGSSSSSAKTGTSKNSVPATADTPVRSGTPSCLPPWPPSHKRYECIPPINSHSPL
ncbi:SDR family oxidoreductase [Arthrobacter sp. GMC3]|uniref:SDR family oxidoreductase n=1 Tax=Arthrobacter sp. GMC3 TaxID=2058894 RepID=UPI001C6726E3|nr:SDR family oxidoreductase [Arthrobacter sp. GMC3]